MGSPHRLVMGNGPAYFVVQLCEGCEFEIVPCRCEGVGCPGWTHRRVEGGHEGGHWCAGQETGGTEAARKFAGVSVMPRGRPG